jgi:anti-sigma-K factor RskA
MSDDTTSPADEKPSDDLLAAEYVLGTLSHPVRAEIDSRLANEPALQVLVAAWSMRLLPLAESLPPVEPPAHLWPQILRRISPTTVVSFTPSRRRWIIAAGAMAAGIALTLLVAPQILMVPQPFARAELASTSTGSAHFTIAVSDRGANLTATPQTVTPVAEKSFELWLVPKGQAPISLGVIDAQRSTDRPIDPGLRAALQEGVTLAVTVEPVGGSPSGKPTGAIVFAGVLKLAAAD